MEPWTIDMKPGFVDHCLLFAEELVDALGAFVYDLCMKHGDPDLPEPPDWMTYG